jgi:hypothetical protein
MCANGAKRLLRDSVTRTFDGYHNARKGAVLTGCGHLLLARAEAVGALALSIIFLGYKGLVSYIVFPFYFPIAISLNLASRLPALSSYERVQKFTDASSDHIYRTFRIYVIAIPVISLFLAASCVSIFLPGVLQPENMVFSAIDSLLKPLGPLQSVEVYVSGERYIGTPTEPSPILGQTEEEMRALSPRNDLEKVISSSVIYHCRDKEEYQDRIFLRNRSKNIVIKNW